MANLSSWLQLTTNNASDPLKGSGNGAIVNSANAHTGRLDRYATVTVTASGLAGTKSYTVKQAAKAEFVSFNDGDNAAAGKNAQNEYSISGTSNGEQLNFQLVSNFEGADAITLPSMALIGGSVHELTLADGGTKALGTDIDDDPGASAEFAWTINLNIPLNDTVNERSFVLKVWTKKSNIFDQITITQAAGDSRLSLDKTTVNLVQLGTAQNVGVTSNTDWTVSATDTTAPGE